MTSTLTTSLAMSSHAERDPSKFKYPRRCGGTVRTSVYLSRNEASTVVPVGNVYSYERCFLDASPAKSTRTWTAPFDGSERRKVARVTFRMLGVYVPMLA